MDNKGFTYNKQLNDGNSDGDSYYIFVYPPYMTEAYLERWGPVFYIFYDVIYDGVLMFIN